MTISSLLVDTIHSFYDDSDVALVHNGIDRDQSFASEREWQAQTTVSLLLWDAIVCRCPVVSTRVGGPLDIIVGEVNELLAEIEDAKDLGARLSDVLSLDLASWRTMSDAAWQSVQHYIWDCAANAFEMAVKRV